MSFPTAGPPAERPSYFVDTTGAQEIGAGATALPDSATPDSGSFGQNVSPQVSPSTGAWFTLADGRPAARAFQVAFTIRETTGTIALTRLRELHAILSSARRVLRTKGSQFGASAFDVSTFGDNYHLLVDGLTEFGFEAVSGRRELLRVRASLAASGLTWTASDGTTGYVL